jgi:hypothetical protein
MVDPGEQAMIPFEGPGPSFYVSTSLGSMIGDVTLFMATNYHVAPARSRPTRWRFAGDSHVVNTGVGPGAFSSQLAATGAGNVTVLGHDALVTACDIDLTGITCTAGGQFDVALYSNDPLVQLQRKKTVSMATNMTVPFARLFKLPTDDLIFASGGLVCKVENYSGTFTGNLNISGVAQ